MRKPISKERTAYLRGWHDGYERGVENNPFTDDVMRHAYRIGYDAGVFLYCDELEQEDKYEN
jgi:hypothetical protein